MSDMIYALPPLVFGLILGVGFLPWKDTKARNMSALEYWVALQGAGNYSKTSDVLTVTRNGATGTFR